MRKIFTLALFISTMLSTGAFAQNIINESFNVGMPGTWTIVNGGGATDTWFGTTNGYAGNTLNGTQFAFVNSDAAGNAPHPLLSEQLISPSFNGTSFGQIILEFDQYFRVYSTDRGYVEVWNGSTWIVLQTLSTNLGAWNAPNHQTFNITAYANPAMKVRFRYEDNTIWAWWWAVDNVHIYAPPSLDAQITGVTLPTAQCGLTANETISLSGRNNGTSSFSSLPLRYRINNGPIIAETMSGAVAPNATFSYNFTTPANLSAAGIFKVDVWASLPADGVPTNDSLLGMTTKNHIRIGVFPYVEDFETSQGGWFVSGIAPSWAWGTPAKNTIQGAGSGTKAWVTGGLGNTTYADNEHNFVEGPCLDFTSTGAPWVGLNTWWNAESSWDGANLQTSIDSGVTWVNVGQFGDPDNWYTDDAINAAPGGSQEGWTGRNATANGSGGWRRSVHSLAYLAGEDDVMVRIAFASDGSVVDDGFAFDNFNVARQPTMYLGPDVAACDSVTLDAGNFASWMWSNGDTTRQTTVYQTGNYTATIRDSFGFPTADVIHVTVEGPRTWSLGADTVFCVANSFVLAAGPGAASYSWSNAATSQQITASTSGIYSVTATSAIGCVRSDTVVLTFSDLAAAIDPLAAVICRGVPFTFNDLSSGNPTSWFWDFGNGNLSTNQNPTTVYTAGGTFTMHLQVSDGLCTADTSMVVVVDVCSGIPQRTNDALRAFPVPADGQLQLAGLDHIMGAATIEISDVHGRVVYAQSLEEGPKSSLLAINLQSLTSGLYQITVLHADAVWTQKVIVRH